MDNRGYTGEHVYCTEGSAGTWNTGTVEQLGGFPSENNGLGVFQVDRVFHLADPEWVRQRSLTNKPTEYLRRGDRIERWLWVRTVERITARSGMPGDRYEFIDLGRCHRYIWMDYRWRYWLEPGEYVRLEGCVKQVEGRVVRLHYVTVY